jgi:hypothetical protein
MVEDFIPEDMRRQAEAAGTNVRAVAQTVRSITVRGYRPAAG